MQTLYEDVTGDVSRACIQDWRIGRIVYTASRLHFNVVDMSCRIQTAVYRCCLEVCEYLPRHLPDMVCDHTSGRAQQGNVHIRCFGKSGNMRKSQLSFARTAEENRKYRLTLLYSDQSPLL